MRIHEVKTVGKHWVETRASDDTWASGDAGRIYFQTTSGLWKVGGSSSFLTITTGGNDAYISATANDTHTGTIRPTVDNTYNLGHASYRYANIYAVNFVGVSTTATYADVAEKYTMDKEYPIGTVLTVPENDEYEMCAVDKTSSIVSGVISDKPGFLLNADGRGQPVALVGKVKVRILGPVRKGDKIGPAENGCGRVSGIYSFAIALETNPSKEEKLVMCLVK